MGRIDRTRDAARQRKRRDRLRCGSRCVQIELTEDVIAKLEQLFGLEIETSTAAAGAVIRFLTLWANR